MRIYLFLLALLFVFSFCSNPSDQQEKIDALLKKANENLTRGNLGLAQDLLDKASEISPSNVAVLELKDSINAQIQENQLASHDANQTGVISRQASQFYDRALVAYDNNNFESALQAIQEAQSVNPNNPIILNQLALTYSKLRQYNLAESTYRTALAISPENVALNSNFARFLLQQKRYTEALGPANLAYSKDRKDPVVASVAGEALLMNNEIEEGITAMQYACTLAPHDADLAQRLIDSLVYTNKLEQAEKKAIDAGVFNSKSWRLNHALGEIYYNSGRNKEAIEQFRKTLTLNPATALPYKWLVPALLEDGKITEARNILTEGLTKFPDDQKLKEIGKGIPEL